MRMRKTTLAPLAVLALLGMGSVLLPFAGTARSADDEALTKALRAAMEAPDRPADDKARDEDRVPVEKLNFFGLRPDMRVLEIMPGGGWFTRLLAPTLRDKGKLYVAVGTKRVKENLLGKAPFDKVSVLAEDITLTPTAQRGIFDVPELSFKEKDLDAALTFRNLHNLSPQGRANLNKAVFAALKPGGIYGVVDHTRRHNEPDNPENGRRMDPVRAIHEAEQAGFVFEDYSDIVYHADDELRYEVGRRAVAGNTDRFILRFRKPKS